MPELPTIFSGSDDDTMRPGNDFVAALKTFFDAEGGDPGASIDKLVGLTFRIALCSVQSHWNELIPLIRSGRLSPERFISHRMSLSEGAEAYRLFDAKEDGAMKMVMSG